MGSDGICWEVAKSVLRIYSVTGDRFSRQATPEWVELEITMRKNYAVLIDAENISHKTAEAILRRTNTFGNTVIQRMFGNWGNPALVGWEKVAQQHGIERCAPLTHSRQKNASDYALMFNALDILHEGHVDGFVIVSSDGDFTSLAVKLRRAGKDVQGIGSSLASSALRASCDGFTVIESPPAPSADDLRLALEPLVMQSFALSPPCRQMSLSKMGMRLREVCPSFSVASYGHATLSSLVNVLPWVDLNRAEHGVVSLKAS